MSGLPLRVRLPGGVNAYVYALVAPALAKILAMHRPPYDDHTGAKVWEFDLDVQFKVPIKLGSYINLGELGVAPHGDEMVISVPVLMGSYLRTEQGSSRIEVTGAEATGPTRVGATYEMRVAWGPTSRITLDLSPAGKVELMHPDAPLEQPTSGGSGYGNLLQTTMPRRR